MVNTITNQVARVVVALNSFLSMITSVLVAIFLLVGLLLINWKLALSAAALFGGSYGLISRITQRSLTSNSHQITASSGQLVKAVQEGLGAIRDVLLDGNQPLYQNIYIKADRRQRRLEAQNNFLLQFPRYGLEALGMVAIALLGWLLVANNFGDGAVIPLLGALALGAQRLLPALQQAYGGWASMRAYSADLAGVINNLQLPLPPPISTSSPLEFNHAVQFQGVSFCYGPDLPKVLTGLDLEIRRGERIGLVGSTGSGKSTTVDLLMGLLVPSSGRLLVDGVDLHDPLYPNRLQAWRAAISHVPQSIYLADGSIAENIAFGIPKQQIDMDRVRNAAAQAQISNFIESSVDGYKSHVGERGIRLSGGQRQRIGIARALYKQGHVLVFDEATSALDSITEKSVMDSIEGLSPNLTIVIIAHRLTTLQKCDRVIRIESGSASSVWP